MLEPSSDNEDGKIGPVPSGCGENSAILRSRPCTWSRHALRTRPRLAEFSHATLPALIVLAGPEYAVTGELSMCRMWRVE